MKENRRNKRHWGPLQEAASRAFWDAFYEHMFDSSWGRMKKEDEITVKELIVRLYESMAGGLRKELEELKAKQKNKR
jgi:hypothetical protein